MMPGQPPVLGIVRGLRRGLEPAIRQRRQLLRIFDARDHGLDHPPSADPKDLVDNRVELDVGLFERLLDPLDMAGLLAGHTNGPRALTCAQSRVPIEVITSDLAMRAFQAAQQASTMAS
jgi:hypothetical protein